jgi:hypothetical protein
MLTVAIGLLNDSVQQNLLEADYQAEQNGHQLELLHLESASHRAQSIKPRGSKELSPVSRTGMCRWSRGTRGLPFT